MADFIWNTITIKAEGEQLQTILDTIKGDGEDEYIDFNKIIPEPENLFRDNLSTDDEERLAIEGTPNWYGWHSYHWGSKWGACDQMQDGNLIRFETAWSPVPKIAGALSRMFPDVVIEYSFGSYLPTAAYDGGTFVIKNGKVIEHIEPEPYPDDEDDGGDVF